MTGLMDWLYRDAAQVVEKPVVPWPVDDELEELRLQCVIATAPHQENYALKKYCKVLERRLLESNARNMESSTD